MAMERGLCFVPNLIGLSKRDADLLCEGIIYFDCIIVHLDMC